MPDAGLSTSTPSSTTTNRGVLLLNLGSPESADKAAVKRYLTEFLMDPYVVESPWLIRKLLVSGLIVPFRSANTCKAYGKIWRDEEPGSPLLWHSELLAEALQERVDFPIALAMRYGTPEIKSALNELLARRVTEILLIPLYPQHATSTRTTSIRAVATELRKLQGSTRLRVLPPFYQDPGYIQALSVQCQAAIDAKVDLLLFSYHGLPERQITGVDPTGSHCLKQPDCCQTPSPAHASCYRHHAYETSRLVAAQLGLSDQDYRISFQSRLGKLPWLTPYTDAVLKQLPGQGYKRIAVTCPSFVADNLETLEEIGIRGRESFLAAGGEELKLLPCLNAHPLWLDALAGWCESPLEEAAFDALVE